MLINDKVPLDKYFINGNGLFHSVLREGDKLFHILVVPIAFSGYILQRYMMP